MDEKNRKDFLDSLAKSDKKTLDTSISTYEGKVDRDDAVHIVDKMHYIDNDMTLRSVTHHSIRACSFGHVLQGQKITILGRCEICQCYTCSTPGCHYVCVLCGRSLCRRHAKVHTGQAYCSRCNWTYWFKKFWGFD